MSNQFNTRMKPVSLELTMMRRVGELKAENARLKAEVERLEAFATRTIIPNEELKAEVERLTKAGDELLNEWSSGDETDGRNFMKGLVIWNAAKEGKPTSNE